MLIGLGSIVSCRSAAIEYQHLFSLGIGLSENKIPFSQLNHNQNYSSNSVYIAMRDGLISISIPAQNKILTLSSYGDLIRAIYQPTLNPFPAYLTSSRNEKILTNRSAIDYNFHQIGSLVIGENHEILVVHQLHPDQSVRNEEFNTTQDQVVVYFDAHGNSYYLGEEGIGGRPFSAIKNIFAVNNNNLVVVSNHNNIWEIFWFEDNSTLKYQVRIDDSSLPDPVYSNDVAELVTIIPDPTLPRLYLKIDFFNSNTNDDTDDTALTSRIYWIELPSGEYGGYIDIPYDTVALSNEAVLSERYPISYDFLGVTHNEYMVLWGNVLNQKRFLLVIGTNSDVILRREVGESAPNIIFSDYTLSPEGIIVGVLGYHNRVDVVWWRMDAFLTNVEARQRP